MAVSQTQLPWSVRSKNWPAIASVVSVDCRILSCGAGRLSVGEDLCLVRTSREDLFSSLGIMFLTNNDSALKTPVLDTVAVAHYSRVRVTKRTHTSRVCVRGLLRVHILYKYH